MQIKGLKIWTKDHWLESGTIQINKDKIKEIGSISEEDQETWSFPEGYKCIPGMIDVHIHGVNGADTMDATPEALETMAKALAREGTTSFLATTVTQAPEAIESALLNANAYIKEQPEHGQAEVFGIHLEGPFISTKKAGAQPPQYILDADLELFKNWQEKSGNQIKLVTVAPEIPGGLELIKYLKSQGIVASIGHSNGSYVDVDHAIQEGATHVTHLYNGMTGLHHREPGVAGAALLRDELFTEMIVDGIHIHPKMVALAYKLKGKEKTILITDSIRAKCLKSGIYDLGGQTVTVEDGKATLENGTLAGSVLKMKDAFSNFMAYTGASLEDIVQIGSVNPAKQCGVFDRKGSIEAGKDADLLILDDNNELVMTICRGQIAYKKEGVNT